MVLRFICLSILGVFGYFPVGGFGRGLVACFWSIQFPV